MANQRKGIKEAKAERAAKKRRARRRKRALFLISEILTLCILLVIGYFVTIYSKIQTEDLRDTQVNEGVLQEGYTTVALFGVDSREGELDGDARADTMMIVAIDDVTHEVRLVSIYRDLMTQSMGGNIRKANDAYAQGGPQEAINMLNRNFDLDIQEFVTVDFAALSDVIDILGGIEVNVTEDEAYELNQFIDETASVADKEAVYISEGVQTLDGVQAVTYARIRHNVGDDYGRTARQRLVLQLIVDKMKRADITTLNEIIEEILPKIYTSYKKNELVDLAMEVQQYQLGESRGFPFELTDGKVEDVGSVVIPLGVVENVEELHLFLYPNDPYEVTEVVREIAAEIENLSGYSREDYVSEY